MDNINVTIGGPKKSLIFTYKTVLLRNNMDLEDQLFEQDTKYIIKWNFDLGGKTITIPENCILSFDGGVISNGTIVGLNTYIDNVGGLDNILEGVTLEGTWRETVDDELSATSENPIKNKAVYEAIQGIRDEMNEKGYSDNNFSTEEKNKLQNLPTSDELNSALNNKVSAVPGKGLSLNDFTNTLKDKLDSIESNAQANVLADWNETDSNSDSFIKNKPTLLNLSVDNNVANNTNNPVSSKAVKEYVDGVATNLQGSIDNKVDVSGLSRVAQTGSYNDLTDKPNIASELVQADWNENDSSDKSYIRNKPDLALVAISGSYNDLTNKPIIQGIPQSVLDMVEGGPYLTAGDIQNKADKTNATQSLAGLMSALDKLKLDNLTTDIEQALANKADKDYYATNEHGGLITSEEKRRLNTIPSRGFSLDGTVSSVTINLVEKTPDGDGNVDLGNIATLDINGKIPQNLLPEMGSSLTLGEASTQAFPGNRGKNLEDAMETINSGYQSTEEALNAIVSLLWPNGELNAAIVTALKAILDNHESRIKALEGDNPTFPTIDYTNKFNDLIDAFKNNAPPIKAYLVKDSNNTLYKYLYNYYKEAETEFKNDNSPFFLRSNFQEIEGYSEIEGLRGTYTSSYEVAFDAMTAWLMAMCLSELKPSKDNVESNNPSNNQTVFFKVAYDYKGNGEVENGYGKTIPLYNNYHLHCDPMHARLVAGAIYARVRGKLTTDLVDVARRACDGNTISDNDLKDGRTLDRWNNPITAWSALGDMACVPRQSGSDYLKLGYYVNSRNIIPDAPGPYVTGTSDRHTKPWENSQQNPDLFYLNEQDSHYWSLYNYVVDYKVDAMACQNYLMQVEYNNNTAIHELNLQNIKDLWGVGRESEKTYSYEKRTTIATAAVAFFALTNFFFGSRKAHLNTISKGVSEGPSYYVFKFNDLWEGGNQDYTLSGPFADLESYMFNGKASTNKISSIYNFLDWIRETGDNARFPTFFPERGRRCRPLGGLGGSGARNDTFGNPLNGFNNYSLASLFRFSDDNAGKTDDSIHVGWPLDGPNSYPSGHASLTMTTALMLGLIYAESDSSKLLQYMKNSYAVGVSRIITRAHWLSDVIYGRLFATMVTPIINATNVILTNYSTVKNILTGSGPITKGSARVIYGEGGGSDIDVYVLNNSNAAITIGMVQFVISPYGSSEGEKLARYQFNPVTIPAYDSLNPSNSLVKVVSGATTTSGKPYNYNGEATVLWESDNVSLKNSSGDSIGNTSSFPANTLFKNGMTYTIAYGGGTSTAVAKSSGGTGINVTIINKTDTALSFENKLRFLLKNGGGNIVQTNVISLGDSNFTVAALGNAGDSVTFSNLAIGSNSSYEGMYFSDSFTYPGRNYSSNILLYDTNDTVLSSDVVPIMGTEYTFDDNATYEITIGGGGSTPTGDFRMNIKIVNNTASTIRFTGEFLVYYPALVGGGHESVSIATVDSLKDIGWGSGVNRFEVGAGGSITKDNCLCFCRHNASPDDYVGKIMESHKIYTFDGTGAHNSGEITSSTCSGNLSRNGTFIFTINGFTPYTPS